MTKPTKASVSYFRNFIFGVEDGLVSTVAFLAGVSITSITTGKLFLSGVVLIFVEAFSMAAGSFLSEESAEEYDREKRMSTWVALRSSLVMFFSYFAAGLIPLVPYVLLSRDYALWVSVGCTLLALLALGIVSGKLSHTNYLKSGLRAVLVGGIAIALGIAVGSFIESRL